MIWETALLVGILFAFGTWLVLQGSFVRILFGFILLSNAANLLVLAMSANPGRKGAPVVLQEGAPMVDPLPQALILTAIVIGFGVISYLVMLLYRLFLDQKTTNARELFARDSRSVGGREDP
jgi:multicomponent Na+:H+ antiporter subunit C